MEFKGTKGEWYIDEEHSGINEYGVKCTSISCGGIVQMIDVYGSEEEYIANAQLIASAPELLEALMSIENDNGNIPEAIWKMRNEAINKALGL